MHRRDMTVVPLAAGYREICRHLVWAVVEVVTVWPISAIECTRYTRIIRFEGIIIIMAGVNVPETRSELCPYRLPRRINNIVSDNVLSTNNFADAKSSKDVDSPEQYVN